MKSVLRADVKVKSPPQRNKISPAKNFQKLNQKKQIETMRNWKSGIEELPER